MHALCTSCTVDLAMVEQSVMPRLLRLVCTACMTIIEIDYPGYDWLQTDAFRTQAGRQS